MSSFMARTNLTSTGKQVERREVAVKTLDTLMEEYGFEPPFGLKIDTETFRPAIGNKFGGLSGPGIKPIIVRMVYQCAKAVKIPIIGCGGIVKVEDVVEYMLAGASAVMIGYLIFRNPSGLIAIIEGLEQWCAKRGFARVADLTGAMIDEAPRETYAAAAAPIG